MASRSRRAEELDVRGGAVEPREGVVEADDVLGRVAARGREEADTRSFGPGQSEDEAKERLGLGREPGPADRDDLRLAAHGRAYAASTASATTFMRPVRRLARPAQAREGLLLGQALALHQEPLGPLDDLARLERLGQRLGLLAQRLELGVARPRRVRSPAGGRISRNGLTR